MTPLGCLLTISGDHYGHHTLVHQNGNSSQSYVSSGNCSFFLAESFFVLSFGESLYSYITLYLAKPPGFAEAIAFWSSFIVWLHPFWNSAYIFQPFHPLQSLMNILARAQAILGFPFPAHGLQIALVREVE